MTELDKFIEEKAESINTLGITDSISEEYLKGICEEYYLLKQKVKCYAKCNYHNVFTFCGDNGITYCSNCGDAV